MTELAKRVKSFDSGDFRTVFHMQQQLADPIDLSVGIPEELTPEHVKAAGIEAIRQDKTVYTPANGLSELRGELAAKLQQENGLKVSAEQVTVVPGLTTGQLLIYMAILDPGDEVIVLDPYYPPYVHLAEAIGAQVMLVNTLPTFQPDLPAIEASITNRTKAIVINSPNNPTGAVYDASAFEQIAQIAQKHDLLIISDEIYEHFVYDDKHNSIGSIYPNTITMNGFSKEYAMTGWRLGYLTGPSEIVDAINELMQYVVFSSSSIAQHAALAALKHRPNLTSKYRQKRDFLTSHLRRLGYEIHGAQGAYYVFIRAPHDMTDLEFAEQAADLGLIIVPGRAFSTRHGYIRLSYGNKQSELERAVQVLARITELR